MKKTGQDQTEALSPKERAAAERAARLKKALKANMGRRKAQARVRATPDQNPEAEQ